MKRGEIRDYIRILGDELTEAPEGLFTDAQLNTLINISQRKVQKELANYIPWYFRQTKLISLTANKKVYSIDTDLLITDFLVFEKIIPNVTAQEAIPLLYLEPKDIRLHEKVGDTAAMPKGWGYETSSSIFFVPTPASTTASALKAYYIRRIPDLNHDTSDTPPSVATPLLPEEAHQLIAIDVVRQWIIWDKSKFADADRRYSEVFSSIVMQISTPGKIESIYKIEEQAVAKQGE